MALLKSTVDSYIEVLKASGLVEPQELETVLADFRVTHPETADGSADVAALAQYLIARELITLWQHQNLHQGKHKGFFLGNYKLLAMLGRGGMSEVYLAEHRRMRRQVAIKILPLSRVSDGSYLERFLAEARAIAALDHQNIVRAYSVDNEGKLYYMVMEYVEGRDLARIVEHQGPLPFDVAANFIAQAADGLAHAHAKGMVHRDIKPGNLLIDRRGAVRVLDLGLALLKGRGERSLTMEYNDKILGTADYLAPEQAVDSHHVDHRVDIYSLGCTLYYALTAQPLFPEGTITERMLKHLRAAPPSIYDTRPDTPAELVEICEQMLAKRPEDRIQTAAEVSEALRACFANSSTSAVRRQVSRAPLKTPDADLRSPTTDTRRLPKTVVSHPPVPTRQAHEDTAELSAASTTNLPSAAVASPAPELPEEPARELPFWVVPAISGVITILAFIGMAYVVYASTASAPAPPGGASPLAQPRHRFVDPKLEWRPEAAKSAEPTAVRGQGEEPRAGSKPKL